MAPNSADAAKGAFALVSHLAQVLLAFTAGVTLGGFVTLVWLLL